MPETLYRKLKKAEGVNDRLKEIVDSFRNDLKEFEQLPGYNEISIGNTPEIDIQTTQKNLILQYNQNPILSEALNGKKTIEKSLEEVGKINVGIRKFLPRRRNLAHNQRLEYFGELVSYPYSLKSRGILFPDNIITGSIEAFAVSEVTILCNSGK